MMSSFQPRDPAWRARVESIFTAAPFVQHLAITLDAAEPGRCDSSMQVRPEHLQQDGVVHAGVQTTLADHTAGAAAGTLMSPDQRVLSIEFKVNLLRGGVGTELRCVARVLKPGARFSVVEAEVFAGTDASTLTAKLVATMVYVPRS